MPVESPFSSQRNGRKITSDHCIGRTVPSAACVGYCSASAFGTSSPMISWIVVSTASTRMAAADRADRGSSAHQSTNTGTSGMVIVACAKAPSIRLESVMPICDAPT